MDNFVGYADRPFAFIGRYLKERWRSHTVIVTFIALAVMCSVGTQYAVKFLVRIAGCKEFNRLFQLNHQKLNGTANRPEYLALQFLLVHAELSDELPGLCIVDV